MIKFMSLEFLGLSQRIPGKIKNAVYRLEISSLVPEIFELEKCVKYTNERTDDVIHSTQYTLHQFAAEAIEANSSTCNTPTTIQKLLPLATHSFPVSPT